MKINTEKTPLKKAFSLEDYHLYDRKGESGNRLQQFPYIDKVLMLMPLTNWAEDYKAEQAKKDSEPSEELQAAFREAIDYVEDLTNFDLSDVKFVYSDEGTGFSGMFSAFEGLVRSYIDENNFTRLTPELRKKVLTSNLVHELMHATGTNNIKLIGLREQNATTPYVVNGYSIVDIRSATNPTSEGERMSASVKGCFFEEAIAEEAAARWREDTNPEIAGHETTACKFLYHYKSPALPYRYVDTDASEYGSNYPANYNFSGSAYCSEGLRQVGEWTHTDMFQLMLDLRIPEKEASARRSIIQAVESIEKGLYPKLRDLDYSQENFIAGYEMIMAAIEKSRQQREKIGSAAVSA
jgi:hypothetical protein